MRPPKQRAYDNDGRAAKVAQRRASLVELLRGGISAHDVPAVLGVSAKTVARDLTALHASGSDGVPPTAQPGIARSAAKEARRTRVADLHANGQSVGEIAQALGITNDTVRRDLSALAAAGVITRDPLRHHTPLERARVAAGISLAELVERTGLSEATVTAAQRGARPHRDSATRLANAVGADAVELWPDLQEVLTDRVRRPPVPNDDEALAHRRAAVGRLWAEDLTPPQIAARLDISRATVYRDLTALRNSGWQIPPRPFGRPPGATS